MPINISVHRSIEPSNHRSTYLLACLPAHLPTCLPACLPACLPTCLSTCLTACLRTHLFIFLSICPPWNARAGRGGRVARASRWPRGTLGYRRRAARTPGRGTEPCTGQGTGQCAGLGTEQLHRVAMHGATHGVAQARQAAHGTALAGMPHRMHGARHGRGAPGCASRRARYPPSARTDS